MIEQINEVVIW